MHIKDFKPGIAVTCRHGYGRCTLYEGILLHKIYIMKSIGNSNKYELWITLSEKEYGGMHAWPIKLTEPL